MNFMNDKDMFDFSELPSAYGNYGSYGTNHLKETYHNDFADGMITLLNAVKNFAKYKIEDIYYEKSISNELKKEVAEEIMKHLLVSLAGTVSEIIVSFGDDEYVEDDENEKDMH